ncbi:hypothetical protein FACS1894111_12430 [Clostridia bacterium]|nr:hypothetical protein FACS1894111_12430 [Clostridia bacterium]
MRKKSHISLARHLVSGISEQDLHKHRKAFYLGNILPDCKPSFITTKHEIEGTFGQLADRIKRLIEGADYSNLRVFYRDFGQVVHYIADYFTFPHNEHYEGSLKDHCMYEKHLKKSIKQYCGSSVPVMTGEGVDALATAEAICAFIREAHSLYLRVKTNVEADVRWIVTLCQKVVEAIIAATRNYRQSFA